MNCFGKYDYKKEKCQTCSQRTECMIAKYKDDNFDCDLWSDFSDRPNCYGSYKGKDCQECPYLKECTKTTVDLKRDLFRSGKKIRIQGKYKERGSWKRRAGY